MGPSHASQLQRARFSSAAELFTIAEERVVQPSSTRRTTPTHVDIHLTSDGIELTDVPPGTTPKLKVVFGSLGTWMS